MKNLNRLELAMNHLQKIVGYVLMKFLICQHMKATVSCIRMTRCINRSVSKDRAFGFTGGQNYVKSKCSKIGILGSLNQGSEVRLVRVRLTMNHLIKHLHLFFS